MSTQNKSLVLERVVEAPVELVWDSLTNINILKKWRPFFTDFRAEVGFETRFELGRVTGRTYVHICEVTEVIDGKKITYSWRYEGYPGDSYVSFDLAAVDGNKTKITLTHTITEPFPEDNPDFVSRNFVEGWTNTINALKDFTEHTK